MSDYVKSHSYIYKLPLSHSYIYKYLTVTVRSLEPSLLQNEQAQLLQPFFIEEMLESSVHLHSPSLDMLQHFQNLLVLGAPGLGA